MQGLEEAVDVRLQDVGRAARFLVENEIERTAVGKEPDAYLAGWISWASELKSGELTCANRKDSGVGTRRHANSLYQEEQGLVAGVALRLKGSHFIGRHLQDGAVKGKVRLQSFIADYAPQGILIDLVVG